MKKDNPKVFFCYSRDDSEFALKLANDLRSAGANIWIDQLDILTGEHWDRSVEKALETCKLFLIILSPNSIESNNVLDEVSYALEEKKQIIPVVFKKCNIPFRLRRLQRIDLVSDYDKGILLLRDTLNITKFNGVSQPATPQYVPKSTSNIKKRFRSEPSELTYGKKFKSMLKEYGFYDSINNPEGRGIKHIYETIDDGTVIYDKATELMWTQSSSENKLSFKDTNKYIYELNNKKLGNFDDWRLPTLEEMFSLMEAEQNDQLQYINPLFGPKPEWNWTSDKYNIKNMPYAWTLGFSHGRCANAHIEDGVCFVLAVRSA